MSRAHLLAVTAALAGVLAPGLAAAAPAAAADVPVTLRLDNQASVSASGEDLRLTGVVTCDPRLAQAGGTSKVGAFAFQPHAGSRPTQGYATDVPVRCDGTAQRVSFLVPAAYNRLWTTTGAVRVRMTFDSVRPEAAGRPAAAHRLALVSGAVDPAPGTAGQRVSSLPLPTMTLRNQFRLSADRTKAIISGTISCPSALSRGLPTRVLAGAVPDDATIAAVGGTDVTCDGVTRPFSIALERTDAKAAFPARPMAIHAGFGGSTPAQFASVDLEHSAAPYAGR